MFYLIPGMKIPKKNSRGLPGSEWRVNDAKIKKVKKWPAALVLEKSAARPAWDRKKRKGMKIANLKILAYKNGCIKIAIKQQNFYFLFTLKLTAECNKFLMDFFN